MAAYDPRCMKGMGIAYATSNRGACHLRGYTPAAEILGIPEKVDPYEWEGKGELTATFQNLHAVSDSFDICKFSAFAEGIEEYVLQYNGMTGRDVTEDELFEAGERVYNLERYYNNLVGFDGADDTLPNRFIDGHPDAIPGTGASEGELAELDEMKAEYYETRGWVDGVVPDESSRRSASTSAPVPVSPPATPQPPPTTERSLPAVGFLDRNQYYGAARTACVCPRIRLPVRCPIDRCLASLSPVDPRLASLSPVDPRLASPRRSSSARCVPPRRAGLLAARISPARKNSRTRSRFITAETPPTRSQSGSRTPTPTHCTAGPSRSTATASERGPSRSPGRRRRSS